MKPILPILAIATALFLSSVVGQQQATSSYSLSEIALYHPKNSERYGVFSGEPQTVLWNNGRLELSKAVTMALNGFVVPRTLAVNGSNTLKLDAQELNAFDGNFIGEQIQIRAKRNLQSVYYFDGTKWFTVARNLKANEVIQLKPTPRLSPLGAGLLSSEEALALAKYLTPKGELLLATLLEADAPDARLELDPAPSAYRRSLLAVQYGVPRNVAVVAPPKPIVSPTPKPVVAPTPKPIVTPTPKPVVTPPIANTSIIIPVIQTLESGNNAAYSKDETYTRFDENDRDFLETWKMIAGNQIPLPTAPRVDFNNSRIITVFLGQRPTGGYAITYKRATLEGSTLKLSIETTAPLPDRIVTQALTSPFVMLEVKNTQFNTVQVDFENK